MKLQKDGFNKGELLKINRLLSIAMKINGLIVHSRSLDDIFNKACELVITHGDFKLAWIGLLDQSNEFLIPMAKKGSEESYLDEIIPITVKDVPQGRGPSGTAFRERKVILNNDMQNNPLFAPWRESARKKGFNSSIALPLYKRGKVIGTFNIYSPTVDYFTDSEVEILEDITRNMSFAIELLEDRAALEKSELKFRTMFEEAPMGIVLADGKTGEILQANDRFLNILGQKGNAVIGKTWVEITAPEDVPKDLENTRLLGEKKISGFKTIKRYLRPGHSIVWADTRVVSFKDKEGSRVKNLVMIQDITDRIKLEEELRKSIEIKDEFFAIASHELKTPITSLKLQLQLIRRSLDASDEKLLKGVDNSIKQVNRLNDLVSNLLDVSNFRFGKIALKKEKCNFSRVVIESVEKFEHLLKEKGSTLNLAIEPDIEGVCDKNRLEQVFSNLLDNILKYAPGVPVYISFKRKGGKAVFIIKDEGPGIDPKKIDKIFDRFERLGADRGISGMGLGLYIVEKIIEALEGNISVKSEPVKGTEFTVTLPL